MLQRAIEASKMKTNTAPTEAARKYAAAHAMHYATKDLREALELYGGVLAFCPNAPEAEYSRAQIRNIVDAVVPKPLILETLLQLAITRLTHGDAALQADSSQAGPAPAGVSA